MRFLSYLIMVKLNNRHKQVNQANGLRQFPQMCEQLLLKIKVKRSLSKENKDMEDKFVEQVFVKH